MAVKHSIQLALDDVMVASNAIGELARVPNTGIDFSLSLLHVSLCRALETIGGYLDQQGVLE